MKRASTFRLGFATVAFCLIAGFLPESAAETRIVYRRSVPTEAWTGVVSLRQLEEMVVDIPVDCVNEGDGTLGCRTSHRFSRVYGLQFGLERRVSTGGRSRIGVDDRGRAFLLLRFDSADRKAFDEELRNSLAGLSADAFSDEFAGLKPGQGPFSEIARRSVEPSWSCFENGPSPHVARYDRTVEERSDGVVVVHGSGMTGFGDREVTRRLCDDVSALVNFSTDAEELRAMPLARTLREDTVQVDIAHHLRHGSFPEELLELPPELTYTLERDPGVTQSASLHTSTDDPFTRATYTRDEVKFTAATRPIRIPPEQVTKNAWIARWVVETSERTMGPAPTERTVGRSSLLVALLPTPPPERIDIDASAPLEGPETHRIDLDVDAFLAEVGSRLDRVAVLDADALEDVIAEDPAGLRSQGWLMTVCREDGSARFGLLPTQARSSVTNAGAFCAAVETSLAIPAR